MSQTQMLDMQMEEQGIYECSSGSWKSIRRRRRTIIFQRFNIDSVTSMGVLSWWHSCEMRGFKYREVAYHSSGRQQVERMWVLSDGVLVCTVVRANSLLIHGIRDWQGPDCLPSPLLWQATLGDGRPCRMAVGQEVRAQRTLPPLSTALKRALQ